MGNSQALRSGEGVRYLCGSALSKRIGQVSQLRTECHSAASALARKGARCDHGVGRVLPKLRIGAQFVDGARLGNSLGTVAVFPLLRREGQNLNGLLDGFVNRVPAVTTPGQSGNDTP